MSYVSDYLLYSNCDEAPEMFHLWGAYASMSASVGRRVWLPTPPSVIYANLYLLYVGLAGCGKTQALNKIKFVLAAAGIDMSASVETVEGYIRKLAGPECKPPMVPKDSAYCQRIAWPDGVERKTHQLVITASEFVDFIRVGPENWIGFLNNVYDEDHYTYDTKNGGKDKIEGPYITLIGAIPTDVSKKLQEFDIINTGFGRRTIMQFGKRRFENPVPRPTFTSEQEAARTRCIEFLKKLKTRPPAAVTETPEAANFYDDWYRKHSMTLEERATPATHGWLSSKPTQVRKIALLNALSDHPDDRLIVLNDYEVSLRAFSEMEKTMNMVFGGIGRNELAGLTLRVLDYLTARGPTTLQVMLKDFYNDLAAGTARAGEELRAILTHLVATSHLVHTTRKIGTSDASVFEVWSTPEGLAAFDAAVAALPDGAVRIGTGAGLVGEARP